MHAVYACSICKHVCNTTRYLLSTLLIVFQVSPIDKCSIIATSGVDSSSRPVACHTRVELMHLSAAIVNLCVCQESVSKTSVTLTVLVHAVPSVHLKRVLKSSSEAHRGLYQQLWMRDKGLVVQLNQSCIQHA
jgi:hypothetical protein